MDVWRLVFPGLKPEAAHEGAEARGCSKPEAARGMEAGGLPIRVHENQKNDLLVRNRYMKI